MSGNGNKIVFVEIPSKDVKKGKKETQIMYLREKYGRRFVSKWEKKAEVFSDIFFGPKDEENRCSPKQIKKVYNKEKVFRGYFRKVCACIKCGDIVPPCANILGREVIPTMPLNDVPIIPNPDAHTFPPQFLDNLDILEEPSEVNENERRQVNMIQTPTVRFFSSGTSDHREEQDVILSATPMGRMVIDIPQGFEYSHHPILLFSDRNGNSVPNERSSIMFREPVFTNPPSNRIIYPFVIQNSALSGIIDARVTFQTRNGPLGCFVHGAFYFRRKKTTKSRTKEEVKDDPQLEDQEEEEDEDARTRPSKRKKKELEKVSRQHWVVHMDPKEGPVGGGGRGWLFAWFTHPFINLERFYMKMNPVHSVFFGDKAAKFGMPISAMLMEDTWKQMKENGEVSTETLLTCPAPNIVIPILSIPEGERPGPVPVIIRLKGMGGPNFVCAPFSKQNAHTYNITGMHGGSNNRVLTLRLETMDVNVSPSRSESRSKQTGNNGASNYGGGFYSGGGGGPSEDSFGANQAYDTCAKGDFENTVKLIEAEKRCLEMTDYHGISLLDVAYYYQRKEIFDYIVSKTQFYHNETIMPYRLKNVRFVCKSADCGREIDMNFGEMKYTHEDCDSKSRNTNKKDTDWNTLKFYHFKPKKVGKNTHEMQTDIISQILECPIDGQVTCANCNQVVYSGNGSLELDIRIGRRTAIVTSKKKRRIKLFCSFCEGNEEEILMDYEKKTLKHTCKGSRSISLDSSWEGLILRHIKKDGTKCGYLSHGCLLGGDVCGKCKKFIRADRVGLTNDRYQSVFEEMGKI